VKRLLKIGLITIAGCYLAFLGLLFVAQRAMLFPAPRNPMPLGRSVQHLEVADAFGKMPAVFRPPADGKPVIAFFHGNGGQLADAEWLAAQLSPRGLGVFSVEYPGYAGAPGAPSEEAIFRVADEGIRQLETQIPHDRWVMMGQSLGTGVAVEMAARGHGKKLVLVSPFTSIPDVAVRQFPIAPGFLVRDPFDSASKAAGISIPVLEFHGTADEVVPYDLGKRLSSLFPHCTLITLQGAHHNDVIDRADVLKQIVDFALGSP
jgi:pimeloyl-ACP methyl ester carboxylesterase